MDCSIRPRCEEHAGDGTLYAAMPSMNDTWRVFGPVRSSRLGVSLGIDPLRFKTCSYDCVYCQLGRTRVRRVGRRAHVQPACLLAELSKNLNAIAASRLDWITVVGSGEPTLYAGLGDLLQGIRATTDVKLAVITNGSLLGLEEVRRELMLADAVLPSLDAGDERTFQAINRPHESLGFTQVLDGLLSFRSEYRGSLRIEVMLVAGVNDGPAALEALEAVLARVKPDEVHVNTPSRPPAEQWVQPPSYEVLQEAADRLGSAPPRPPQPRDPAPIPRRVSTDLLETILSIVGRHPMTAPELATTLNVPNTSVVESWLRALQGERILQQVERFDQVFWTTSSARHEGVRPRRRRRPRR